MRRMVLLLAGVLLSTVAMGSDSPKEYDDKTTLNPLEGSWRLTEYSFRGQTGIHPDELVLTYRGGFCTNKDSEPRRYCIAPSQTPAHLDWIELSGPSKGETSKFIFQIKGDTLKMACFSGSSKTRPQVFNDDEVVIYTFKRVKK